MKISALLLLLATFMIHAESSLSQVKRVTIDLSNVTLSDVFDEIESQTEYNLFYNKKTINDQAIVSIKVEDEMVATLLKTLLSDKDVDFKLLDNSIIIVDSEKVKTSPTSQVQQQNLSVTGKVSDEKGESMPGVSVIIKGTSTGTITDIDGNFILNAEKGSTLVFSFIGMESQEVVIENTNINIKMQSSLINLQEVVAIGYGSMKKSDLTGAVVSANMQDFRKSPNTNLGQSLQGSVPGLNIGQVTSSGSTPSISIRGASTISGNSNVLIILDGVPYNSSLSSINPDDIESIDVLKDASSTAVYGAQAANGVILITTKKGKIGEGPKITLSSSYTTQTPTVDLRPMNREEYIDHVRDLYWDKAYLEDGSLDPEYDVVDDFQSVFIDEESGQLLENDYDWWDKGTNPGFIKEYQLSIAGGGNKVSYLISGGLTDQSGYVINDDFKRKSIRINLESQATSWLKLGVQSFGSFVNKDGAEPNLWRLMTQSPLLVPYDENGDIIPYPFNTQDTNPFMGSEVDDYERHNYFFANIYSEIDIPFIKGLSYRFNYGNNYRIDKQYNASEYGASMAGEAYKNFNEYYDYTFDNILTYNRNFNNNSITATLLYGAVDRKYSYTSAMANEFSRLNLGYNSLELGTNQYTYSDAWDEALNYQMARINYKFQNKYLLTATVRRDGFSGFAENEKYAIFPSVALGWVITEDINTPQWIEYLKLRGGYGISGNQTSRYNSLSRMSTFDSYVFGDGGTTLIGQEVSSLGNSDLRWEKTAGINLGIDFSLVNSNISGNIEYYNNKTNDLLFNVALPSMSGFNNISTNIGELKNTGFELMLTSRNINKQDFKWSTTLSFSTNKNKIIKLTGADNDGDGKEDDLIASNLFIGESLGTIYNYEVDGIYQLDDEIPAGYYAGTYRIVDQDGGDYEITTDDKVILGRSEPAYRASLMNKLEYKRFSLSIFLNTIQGGKDGYMGNNSHAISRGTNTLIWNYISDIDYWSPGNPNGEYPQSVSTPTITPRVYYDRSFVRLQDVILSYYVPSKLLNKINVKDLSIYVNGKNLATWTSWKGWDPETGSGLDTGGRPVMKGYSLGFNLTF
ncbi:SusC/RagA family TonB-linked outer membrane protein [Plebeiibacterium marinum]|uniref:TonB-dependent receptor n=1 Tax=Plebeiibacterium marinum TaxID=2992111 RepID=A0AAE3SKS4_9BACT|nr:TonB-dependent receptor [Plebeiobacterium marinum]MCW3806932.1 TonB-dependent receptor [Plebeiobacterium marinum]